MSSDHIRGPLAWFVRNSVAANLLMLVLILGGLFVGMSVKQEVFPDFKLDIVRVEVDYPGASPSEIEQGIILVIEEAVRGLEGVDRVSSAAIEGRATINVELLMGAERITALSDIKNAVDGISSFPEQAERPTVALVNNRVEVVSLILYGDQDPAMLRRLAERTRDELLTDPGITTAELVGAPPHEIHIEVSQAQLRTYGLTIDDIAQRVASSSLELPGGTIKTLGGEVLLRTHERRHKAEDFRNIPIVTGQTGTEVTLGDIASIQAGFAETDESATFDGHPAAMLKVFRTGNQTPVGVATAVHDQVERLRRTLPTGIHVATWLDWSEIYKARVFLLLKNAGLGLVLVLVILGLFLEIRLAFWVTMGIPVSFLGALLLMPAMSVTINMISLFAFIIVLGMVVDDAIVVGENIFDLREKGMKPLDAAILGARRVAMPVCFAIATSVAAFAPMAFVPGFSGKLYRVIPAIVVSVLLISLAESLLVLPAHLAHLKEPRSTGLYAVVHREQQKVKRGLEWFIKALYSPFLRLTIDMRYFATAAGIALLIATFGFVQGGHIPFRFMPDIEGDVCAASLEMPFGTPVAETTRIQQHLLKTAQAILDESGETGIVRGVFSQIGTPQPGDPGLAEALIPGGHIAAVQVFFVDASERKLQSGEFLRRWREQTGLVPGAEKLTFRSLLGPSPGKPIDVELQHNNMDVLEAASTDLAKMLRKFPEVYDIDDGFAPGKPQLDLELTPEATGLGLTSAHVASQVRNAYYGAEALRQQEGRNEVRVLVRLPQAERTTLHDVETLLLRTPSGGEIPLRDAADILRDHAYPVIKRANGTRLVAVTADVREGTSPDAVLAALAEGPLQELAARYPGLTHDFGGAHREQAKSMGTLQTGGFLAMLAIYGLLAIPFRSYIQPIIVMAAIPFGFVGAVAGHVIMGFEMSMISVMGLIALAGVVVNDSLVLIDAANELRANGLSAADAIHAAGVRRFRPIMLTSLTTFFGLIPMIAETSVQALFLVPMAISLGFGVLFATMIILLLIPAFYMQVEDLTWFARWLWESEPIPTEESSTEESSPVDAEEPSTEAAAYLEQEPSS